MYLKLVLSAVMLTLTLACSTTSTHQNKIDVLEGEQWWIGIVTHGHLAPLSDGYNADLNGFLYENQAQPLLVSNAGRSLWSEEPFAVTIRDGAIYFDKNQGEIVLDSHGSTLKEAYLGASAKYFPATGTMPDESLFLQPQYNTWIELLYDQNQTDILKYAQSILDNGFPPGVIMIDDNWQQAYGVWEFRHERFEDPKAMVRQLHDMGFKVMMWVCPFVSPDTQVYRELRDQGLLLKDETGRPKPVHWWNGQSAVLDLSNPAAGDWFKARLQYLVDEYGVDGFKLDAGDAEYYVDTYGYKDVGPNEHARLFAEIGLDFPLNEYRATWKMGGQPLAQRLRDKGHSWGDLQVLVPHILTQGLSGYAFTCPDMIGGGLMGSFINLEKVDQELMVRSTQTHALMPMMQFSVAPWRVLSSENLEHTKQAIKLRAEFIPVIMDLARHAAQTGEPIVRYLEYEFPGNGYHAVVDQFMLGSDIVVAPVLEPGQRQRQVHVPPGEWTSHEGKSYTGPALVTVEAPLNTLPYLRKQ